jgi:lipopolysaccharide/colanic/teichoic acid biosynthesis glycosyltransferase
MHRIVPEKLGHNAMSQVTTSESHDERLYFIGKRIMDIVLAGALLVILGPLLVIISIAIALDSPGPILTAQERVGARRRTIDGQTVWDVRNFRVYRFRTLNFAIPNTLPHGAQFTRVGRVLSHTYLDELPQLFNVLGGTMSLVGPRPVPAYEAAEYQDWHRERLKAIPGIVGLWHVSQHFNTSFDDQVRVDIAYVRSRSLWLDVKILFLTIPTLLIGRIHN